MEKLKGYSIWVLNVPSAYRAYIVRSKTDVLTFSVFSFIICLVCFSYTCMEVFIMGMSISEQIKILCVRSNISTAELSRRLGVSPQSLSAKLKRESFTISDLDKIADAVGAQFERSFVLHNGERV